MQPKGNPRERVRRGARVTSEAEREVEAQRGVEVKPPKSASDGVAELEIEVKQAGAHRRHEVKHEGGNQRRPARAQILAATDHDVEGENAIEIAPPSRKRKTASPNSLTIKPRTLDAVPQAQRRKRKQAQRHCPAREITRPKAPTPPGTQVSLQTDLKVQSSPRIPRQVCEMHHHVRQHRAVQRTWLHQMLGLMPKKKTMESV